MRVVCLSAEGADLCARLGAWEEVVAVSAFASQEGLPRRTIIGGFSTTDGERVAALRPDLVICFSDVQADIAARLIRLGCPVLATNQRTLAEIADTISMVGGALGRGPAAAQLRAKFLAGLEALTCTAGLRPRVYFEEWPEPQISAIGWVGELIELCGGEDVFAGRRGRAARERTVTRAEVIAAQPDIMVASWCGKPVDIGTIRARPGFATIRAVQDGQVHAIDSDLLLQPGFRVLEGGQEFRRIFDAWRQACIPAPPHPP